jgi:hypothetical protein
MVNKGSKHSPNWTERQVGVYHKFGTDQKAVMIVLQTGYDNELEMRMKSVLAMEKNGAKAVADPMELHRMILSTYLDNWRHYLRDKGSYCRDKVSRHDLTG